MKIILSETQLKRLYVSVIEEDINDIKIFTDHDSVWNYRVVDGQWETSKKSNQEKWFSLSNPKFKVAVDKLDKKYPNARNSGKPPINLKPPIDLKPISEPSIDSEPNDMKLLHPLKGQGVVTSRFGKRNINVPGASRDHKGIDIGVKSGTPVYSPEYGLILSATDTTPNGCGGFVKIEHGDFISKFCHLSKWVVKKGENVKRGQLIGYTGGGKNDPYKGISGGPHLHYEIRSKNNVPLNPQNFRDNLA